MSKYRMSGKMPLSICPLTYVLTCFDIYVRLDALTCQAGDQQRAMAQPAEFPCRCPRNALGLLGPPGLRLAGSHAKHWPGQAKYEGQKNAQRW